MKVFFLTTYYDEYLRLFYRHHPGISSLPYRQQLEALLADYFAWPAELAEHMRSFEGIDAEMVVYNAETLQRTWAREARFDAGSKGGEIEAICLEQIKRFRPDVLWVFPFELFGSFIERAAPYTRKVITWVGSPFFTERNISGISALITENPETFRTIQHKFDEVVVTTPGYAYSEILRKLGSVKKRYGVTFVGGLSPVHCRRAEVLAALLSHGIDIEVFGYIRESSDNLAFTLHLEKLRPVHHGPVYGLDYYRVLAESHVTLNIHIDCAGDNSGNARLFEATGMGACVLTERSRNIDELFVQGKEVLTYQSTEDLVDTLKALLVDKDRSRRIGLAGQRRSLETHTLKKMFEDIKPVLAGTAAFKSPAITLSAPRLLNVGCGSTFHQDWTNIDIAPQNEHIGRFDVRAGIAYENERFDAVYHSHMLEHLNRDEGEFFIRECYRVMKRSGVIRVAVPDLEQITRRYLAALEKAVQEEPSAHDHYEWMKLELYDQVVREKSGGEMLEYLRKTPLTERNFIIERIGGAIFKSIDDESKKHADAASVRRRRSNRWRSVVNLARNPSLWKERLAALLLGEDYTLLKAARFRQAGEVHRFMYDRYSLSRLLQECGFSAIRSCTAVDSEISNWKIYHLDADLDETPRKPDSLFMEARKA